MVIRYLLADGLSLLGNSVAAVALPLLMLARTGDVAAAGVIAAACALPMLLAAVVGGLVVDRVGRRRTSVCADLGSAAAVAALPLVDAAGGLTEIAFVLLGVAGALADVPGMTAREALGPDIAAATGTPLERLAGLREGVGGTVLVVGPALAGGLIALVDPATVLWLTASCSLLAALVTMTLPNGVGGPTTTARGGTLADIREGVAVLRGDRVVLALTVLTVAGVAVLAPLQGLLLPAHLLASGFPAGAGLVITAMALGSMVGAALYAGFGTTWSRRRVFVGSTVVTALGIVGMGLLPPVPLLLAAAGLAGLGSGPLPALVFVLTAERIPDAARGRVLGLQTAGMMVAGPAGLLAAGFLIEGAGVAAAGGSVIVAWIAVAVLALVAPALRNLEGVRVDHR